jgi:hypothetical protein
VLLGIKALKLDIARLVVGALPDTGSFGIVREPLEICHLFRIEALLLHTLLELQPVQPQLVRLGEAGTVTHEALLQIERQPILELLLVEALTRCCPGRPIERVHRWNRKRTREGKDRGQDAAQRAGFHV